jgi:pimeloyl-ACP methyl ester carboxylesterase
MNKIISVFRSPEGEAQYYAAYDAVLKQWPVAYEEVYVPTRFGDTHVIISGAKNAPRVFLLHPAGGGAVIWIRNVKSLGEHYWIWQDFPKEECIGQLRSTTAITGRPRHWSPTVFSDEELRKIQTPVLLLIGDHEVIYKPEDAIQRASRLMINLKTEIIPNANHIAEYTAADLINQKVLDFLSDVGEKTVL